MGTESKSSKKSAIEGYKSSIRQKQEFIKSVQATMDNYRKQGSLTPDRRKHYQSQIANARREMADLRRYMADVRKR